MEQVEKLQRTALMAYKLNRENKNLKAELEEYKQKLIPEKTSLSEKLEAIDKSKKLEALEKAINKEPPEFRQRIKLVATSLENGIKQEKNKSHEER